MKIESERDAIGWFTVTLYDWELDDPLLAPIFCFLEEHALPCVEGADALGRILCFTFQGMSPEYRWENFLCRFDELAGDQFEALDQIRKRLPVNMIGQGAFWMISAIYRNSSRSREGLDDVLVCQNPDWPEMIDETRFCFGPKADMITMAYPRSPGHLIGVGGIKCNSARAFIQEGLGCQLHLDIPEKHHRDAGEPQRRLRRGHPTGFPIHGPQGPRINIEDLPLA